MNLKINKSAIAALATSFVLLTGCTTKQSENERHTHLVVNFGSTPVIFRECDGLEIDSSVGRGYFEYKIMQDEHVIFDVNSYAIDYNRYTVTDEELIKPIEDKMIEDGAYVYKIK